MSRLNNQLFERLAWQRPRPEEEFFSHDSISSPTRRERERTGALRIQCSTTLQELNTGPRTPDYAQGTLGEEVAPDIKDQPPSPPLSNMAACRASRPRRYSATYATTHALPVPHPPLNANQVARKLVSTAAQLSYNKGAARSVLDRPHQPLRPGTAPSVPQHPLAAGAADSSPLFATAPQSLVSGSQTSRPASGPGPGLAGYGYPHSLPHASMSSTSPLPKLGSPGLTGPPPWPPQKAAKGPIPEPAIQVIHVGPSPHPSSKPSMQPPGAQPPTWTLPPVQGGGGGSTVSPLPPMPQGSGSGGLISATPPQSVQRSFTPTQSTQRRASPLLPQGTAQHRASPKPGAPLRNSKEALILDLQLIAARTGQSFAALQRDSGSPKAWEGPPPGWTPAHGLWKDPEHMSLLQEAGFTYEQIRHAEWERNSHTNKVSRLLRLGTEANQQGTSQRGSEAGDDLQLGAALSIHINAPEGGDAVGGLEGTQTQGEGEDGVIKSITIGPVTQIPAGEDGSVTHADHSVAQAVVQAGRQADVFRVQRAHVDDQMDRLRAGPGAYNPTLRHKQLQQQQQQQRQQQMAQQRQQQDTATPPGTAQGAARLGQSLSPLLVGDKLQAQDRQDQLKQALAAVKQRDREHQKMLRRAERYAARKAAKEGPAKLKEENSTDYRGPFDHGGFARLSGEAEAVGGNEPGSSRSSKTGYSSSLSYSSSCSSSGISDEEDKRRSICGPAGVGGAERRGRRTRGEPKSVQQKKKEGMVMVGGQWRHPTQGLVQAGKQGGGGGESSKERHGRGSRRATMTVECADEEEAGELSSPEGSSMPTLHPDDSHDFGSPQSRLSRRLGSNKSSVRRSMQSQKSRVISRRQSCLNIQALPKSEQSQPRALFAHMSQVTRRLGLARSRVQHTSTPTVLNRPVDPAAAAAAMAIAGVNKEEEEGTSVRPSRRVTESEAAAAERERLHALAEQALRDGLFLEDPDMLPDTRPDEVHDTELKVLKNINLTKEDKEITFSRLLKPAGNSMANQLQLDGQCGWDPAATLNWSSRGIGPGKMGVLKQSLMANAHLLTGLQLAGNNLDNNCIVELLLLLGDPKAPHITQLDLEMNTSLTWRCARALALALGTSPAVTAAAEAGAQPPDVEKELKIKPLHLKRLLLTGTKLGDKGASEIASALKNNNCLKALALSRCSIGDGGGRALMDALGSNNTLALLDVSWNALRGESARMLANALLRNGGIQHLDLSHNGFSDADAARIIKSLADHGHWRHVDLSYNNVGAGAALVMGSLAKKLAEAASRHILKSKYGVDWDSEVQAGYIDYTGWFEPDAAHGRAQDCAQGQHQVTLRQPSRPGSSLANHAQGQDPGTAHAPPANLADPHASANATTSSGDGSRGAPGTAAPDYGASGAGAEAGAGPARPPAAARRGPAHLGEQLTHGPLLLDLGCNPLGTSGMLQVLHAFDACSKEMEAAQAEVRRRRIKERQERRAQRAEQAAALERAHSARRHKPKYSFYDASQGPPKPEATQEQQQAYARSVYDESSDDGEEEEAYPWPLYVSVQGCNVLISDSLQEDAQVSLSGGAQRDPYSPNPFLQSLHTIMHQEQPQGKRGKSSSSAPQSASKGAKKGPESGRKGKKGPVHAGLSKEYVFNAESQAIDITSPAGQYKLDLAHPASAVIVSKILDLKAFLAELAASGKATPGAGMALRDITIDDKPIKAERLEAAADVPSGMLSMSVAAPSLLLATEPWPIKDSVVGWMLETLEERGAGDLFKLAVIEVACSHFFFSAPQALQLLDLFDPEMSSSERLKAAEVLYIRCYNPLDFWETALPELSTTQVESIKLNLGELGAFNINNPSGRFMLNLSRSIDRLVALRLQCASALEAPWNQHRYFINWRNAQLNGVALEPEGLAKKLRDYSIPAAGTLKIDYVMYHVPNPENDVPCSEEELKVLKLELRGLNKEYAWAVDNIRNSYFAFGQTKAEKEAKTEKAAASKKGGAEGLPPPKKKFKWRAEKTMAMHVSDMVRIMVEEQEIRLAQVQTVPTASSITAAETWSPFPSASNAPPPLVMPKVNHQTAQQQQQQQQKDEASVAWWAGTGFNGKGLQRRQAERDMAALMALQELEEKLDLLALEQQRAAEAKSAATPSRPDSGVAEEGTAKQATVKKGGDKKKEKESDKKKEKEKEDKKKEKDTGRKWKGEGRAVPRPIPSQRYPGICMTPLQMAKAEELAVRLLSVLRPSDVQLVLSRYSLLHTARVLHVFLTEDPANGPQVCARLLEMMPPLAAIYFLHDMFDAQMPLFPAAVRRQLLGVVRPNVNKVLDVVQRLVNRAGLKRARQIRCTLQVFAAHHHISAAQLTQVLRMLPYEQDRGTAVVALWSRVVDRDGLFETWQELGGEEQRQVQQRLGHWHVWTTLKVPHGMHMYLDIKEPEQHDIAREVVRMAVKETMKAKAAARKQGVIQVSQQLADLHGNGQLLLMPEDDKSWSMLESSYSTLEFDYVPNSSQATYHTAKAVKSIQRKWRRMGALRKLLHGKKCTSILAAPTIPRALLDAECAFAQGQTWLQHQQQHQQ